MGVGTLNQNQFIFPPLVKTIPSVTEMVRVTEFVRNVRYDVWVSLGSLQKGGHRSTHTSERRLEFNPHNLPSLVLSRHRPYCLLSRDQIQFPLCARLNNTMMDHPPIQQDPTQILKTRFFLDQDHLILSQKSYMVCNYANPHDSSLDVFIFNWTFISVCICWSDASWHSSTQLVVGGQTN